LKVALNNFIMRWWGYSVTTCFKFDKIREDYFWWSPYILDLVDIISGFPQASHSRASYWLWLAIFNSWTI